MRFHKGKIKLTDYQRYRNEELQFDLCICVAFWQKGPLGVFFFQILQETAFYVNTCI